MTMLMSVTIASCLLASSPGPQVVPRPLSSGGGAWEQGYLASSVMDCCNHCLFSWLHTVVSFGQVGSGHTRLATNLSSANLQHKILQSTLNGHFFSIQENEFSVRNPTRIASLIPRIDLTWERDWYQRQRV